MAAAAAAAVKRRQEVEAAIAEGNIPAIGTRIESFAQKDPLPPADQTGIWRHQRKVATAYLNIKSQMTVAAFICGNFMINITEKWIDPNGDRHPDLWRGTDLFFNIIFSFELVANMYGFWWRRFWSSGWNVFDVVVVSIGILDVFEVPLPGPLSLLRMMRAFRVFRLFKRIKSLRKILESLAKAMPAHVNAFGILFLVMCIYSILAVDFFMNFASEGFYTNTLNITVPLGTSRELHHGEEYFGNFCLSLFTMFQVLTGDSWSEAVARHLIFTDDITRTIGTTVYFISFQLLCGIVLINVTIAVLLEKMVDDGSEKLAEAQRAAAEAAVSSSTTVDWAFQAAQLPVADCSGVVELENEVRVLRQDMQVFKKHLEILAALAKDKPSLLLRLCHSQPGKPP
ncbi:Cacna1i [Symbiodinium sp. CCMP2592]|nr:Cacna1i [Symbiodinium sp. CCMP2592]